MIPEGLFRSTAGRMPAMMLASALAAGTSWAAPETLVFRNADDETLYVSIDYQRALEIDPPEGWESWADMEKDSAFVTDSGTSAQTSHVRYTHAFYAELNGLKAAGTDYVFYSHAPGDEPHFTSEIAFRFPREDTVESWISGNGVHMADDERLWPYGAGVADSTEFNLMVDIYADGEVVHDPEAVITFLDRRPGWSEDSLPVAIARRSAGPHPAHPAHPLSRWIVPGTDPGLEVPGYARRLILLDANGRTAWKAEALTPGSRIESPAGLRAGAFRCLWLPAAP